MDRRIVRILAATVAIAFFASSVSPLRALELPANIHLTLKLSANQGDESLLDAVREAVEVHPELESEVIDAAVLLRPALAEDIRHAAAVTGEIEVVPAAGPLGLALGPLLALVRPARLPWSVAPPAAAAAAMMAL